MSAPPTTDPQAFGVRLSCAQCRRRKTKCDKASPCAACKHAGLSCSATHRLRLPRGRHAKPKSKAPVLESKVAQLEDLVQQLGTRIRLEDDKSQCPRVPINAQTMFAKDFFTALSKEVAGIRETLYEASEPDEGEDSPEPIDILSPITLSKSQDPNTLDATKLLGFGSFMAGSCTLEFQSANSHPKLLDIYRDRVDCLFKVTHLAGIRGYLKERDTSGRLPYAASALALEQAILFMAICTMTENECRVMLYEEKVALTSRYRGAAEMAISRAGLLTTPDKLVLQAFVLYLMGLRVSKQYTVSWTLVATAIRVAGALGLPYPSRHGTLYIGEFMLLRLMFCIGALDSQTSMDRGSSPITTMHYFRHTPRLVDDSDIGNSIPLHSRNTFCDMSFSHIVQESTICSRRLNEIAPDEPGSYDRWNTKLQIILEFEARMQDYCGRLEDSRNTLIRYIKLYAEHIVLDMHLVLRRPLYRCKDNPSPPDDQFDVLSVAVQVMEQTLWLANDSALAPWVWFSQTSLRWHVLAIILAELCTRRQDTHADRAYKIAKQGFAYYASLMAETDLAPVWATLEKLMARVQHIRSTSATSTPSLTHDVPDATNSASQSSAQVSADTNIPQTMDSGPGYEALQPDDPSLDPMLDFGDDALWLNWDSFLEGMGNAWEPDQGLHDWMDFTK